VQLAHGVAQPLAIGAQRVAGRVQRRLGVERRAAPGIAQAAARVDGRGLALEALLVVAAPEADARLLRRPVRSIES
jgi:hypothetical protein